MHGQLPEEWLDTCNDSRSERAESSLMPPEASITPEIPGDRTTADSDTSLPGTILARMRDAYA